MKKMFALMMLVGLAAGIMVGCGDTDTGVTTLAAFDTKYVPNALIAIGAYTYDPAAGKYYLTADATKAAVSEDVVCLNVLPTPPVNNSYVYIPSTTRVYQVTYTTGSDATVALCYDMDANTAQYPGIDTVIAGVLGGRVPGLGYPGYYLTGMTAAGVETITKYTKSDFSDPVVVTGWGK